MGIGEKGVSGETQEQVRYYIDQTRERLNKEEQEEYSLEYETCLGLLEVEPTVENVVSLFMSLAWDLPSFVGWVLKSITNSEDAKFLMGEATFRAGEWDT